MKQSYEIDRLKPWLLAQKTIARGWGGRIMPRNLDKLFCTSIKNIDKTAKAAV
jgi:hypothetical protein